MKSFNMLFDSCLFFDFFGHFFDLVFLDSWKRVMNARKKRKNDTCFFLRKLQLSSFKFKNIWPSISLNF